MEEQLCEELDKTLLELMGSLQQLSEARKKYGAAVSEGYFNLAKARYSMPPQSVGALQYDSVMTPLVHVETSQESLSSYEELPADECLEFIVRRRRSPGMTGQREVGRVIPDEPGNQLRKRKPVVSSGGGDGRHKEPVEDLGPRDEAAVDKDVVGKGEGHTRGWMEEEEGEGRLKDPLRWFGVLAPHSLRHSQQYFVQAVAHCAEMAGIQAKVEGLRRRYCELSLEKKQLKQSTAE